MSTSSKLIRLAVLALPLLAAAAPAAANVRSANSSTVCQWEQEDGRRGFHIGQDPQSHDYISGQFQSRYSPQDGMYHTTGGEDGPSHERITCNIPRNLPLRTDGMSDLEVRFRAVAPPEYPTVFVSCTAYSYRSDGTLAVAATRSVVVNTASTTTSSLDFGSAITASGSKGYYVLSCELPGYLALHSIYSSENDGVSNN